MRRPRRSTARAPRTASSSSPRSADTRSDAVFASHNLTNDDVTKSFPLQTKYGQGTKGVSGTCSTENCSGTSTSWGPRSSTGTDLRSLRRAVPDRAHADMQLQVSGGDDQNQFFASGGRTDQTGVIVGNNNFYTKNNARLKASHKVFEHAER